MSSEPRLAQEILADQFRITAAVSQLTGEYHRLLQRVAAAGFARQMAEDTPGPDLNDAESAEAAAKDAAEACALQIETLEQDLAALGRELAALK